MGVKAFTFKSPGIFLNEIDQSQLAKEPAPVGPIIIGRAQRGPAMRPITVSSYEEFVQTFGEPIAGGDSSGDVWRSGVFSGPTYGPYAAQAWLANNPTVTYVRLLGTQSDTPDATTSNNAGKAGWRLTDDPPASNENRRYGAYGLFIFPSSSAGGTGGAAGQLGVTGSLAAVWYCDGTVPILSGSAFGGVPNQVDIKNAQMIVSTSDGSYSVIMSGSVGIDGSQKKTFNFNPTSGQFIRKVFNTSPQNASTASVVGLSSTNSNYYGYWLGETFENDIFNNTYLAGVQSGSASSVSMGIIMPLAKFGTARLGQSAGNSYAARTGWITSQVAQGTVPTYGADRSPTKLFRFIALDGGDWIRNNLKVTINNIAPPQNDAQKYGTFDVEIRNINDTDANKKLVESFVDCTLDSASPNYIARKIGDYYYSWDDTNRKLNQIGTYPNNSKFIRVEMAVDNPEELSSWMIPFGVFGPMKYKDVTTPDSADTFILPTSNCFAPSGLANLTASAGPQYQGYRFTFPVVRTRVSSSEDGLTTYKLADWGATTTRGASSLLYNDGLNDILRVPVTGTDDFTSGVLSSPSALRYAWAFNLDEVRITGSYTNGIITNPAYVYTSGSKALGTSYTAVSGTYVDLLNNGVNSFTTVFQGGTDGLNIIEKEPLRNTSMSSTSTNNNSYIYYTYRRAIDSIVDPEIVEANLVSIPGLAFEPLTQYLTQIAEQRGDSLAIIDTSGDSDNVASYVTTYEKSSDQNQNITRAISVDSVVTRIKTRNLNTSYGATYYPWVQISDSNSGKVLAVPPSVVAIGAMSYTDKVQAPWFAPAGFNRGGLSTGNAGLNVVNVVKKLSQADRDKLYPVNINPIASFPNEGIVIFGQKTLQATPSALDRINVRRLMIYIKRGINLISKQILFEPNVETTWNNFKDKADPFLADVKARFGLTDYKLILDKTTTTPDLIDQNIMYAKIYLKPARAIEFIAIDFFITKTGASFPV